MTPIACRMAIMLLSVLGCGMSSATETIVAPINRSETQPVLSFPAFSVLQFKNGLTWLRNVTVKSFAPMQSALHQDAAHWSNQAGLQFAAVHELFKPLGEEANRIMVEQLLDQQMGLQVRDNVRLLWDVNQYRTVNDQRELGLRLGVHFDFR